jgi:hypothetical protein
MQHNARNIDMLRFAAKRQTGGATVTITHDGGEIRLPLTEECLLHAIESGVEALRELRFGSGPRP